MCFFRKMIINKYPQLRKLIPAPLKRIGVRLYVKWILIGSPGKPDKPRICTVTFGGFLPPEGSFIRGGRVKLTYLRKEWGEHRRKFNILYLVSSHLPAYPDIWIEEAKKKGVKTVWNQNGIGTPAWAPENWREINQTMTSLSKADYVAYQSEFSKHEADDMVSKARGLWSVIFNSCDTDIFHPAQVPPSTKPFRIMVMGTAMTAEKVMIPLEALKILTERGFDAELRSYGPVEWPNAEQEIQEKIKEWNLEGKVLRRGKYPHQEAPALYREGHVYVHTKHMDSSPSAILEAMASGLPVIAGRTGGPAEWISEEAGITIEVPVSRERLYYPTPEEVANAIETIAKDWSWWAKGARDNAVKRFSNKVWLNKHREVFRKLGINVE